jgi:DNA mismatch endonuclease (patch repair protein)
MPKLQRNIERDAKNLAILNKDGWQTMIIWECEIEDENHLRSRLSDFLSKD